MEKISDIYAFPSLHPYHELLTKPTHRLRVEFHQCSHNFPLTGAAQLLFADSKSSQAAMSLISWTLVTRQAYKALQRRYEDFE